MANYECSFIDLSLCNSAFLLVQFPSCNVQTKDNRHLPATVCWSAQATRATAKQRLDVV